MQDADCAVGCHLKDCTAVLKFSASKAGTIEVSVCRLNQCCVGSGGIGTVTEFVQRFETAVRAYAKCSASIKRTAELSSTVEVAVARLQQRGCRFAAVHVTAEFAQQG